MNLKIPDQCYLHPHIKKRWINEEIGYGLFAVRSIKKDEILTVCSGRIITKSDFVHLPQAWKNIVYNHGFEINDSSWLAPDQLDPINDVWFLNHSCNPNAGNADAFRSVAIRNIESGEQIAIDYATTDSNDIEQWKEFECRCGAANCRKIIAGDDWMKPELQEKYKGYFQPHIQRKIELLKQIPG